MASKAIFALRDSQKYDSSQKTTTFNVHITINKNQRQRKMTAAGTVEQEQNTYVKH